MWKKKVKYNILVLKARLRRGTNTFMILLAVLMARLGQSGVRR